MMGRNFHLIRDQFDDIWSDVWRGEEYYNKLFELAEDEEDYYLFIHYKLEEITSLSGTNNMDFTDFARVLKELSFEKLTQEEIITKLNLPEAYVNLIYAVCSYNDLLGYGTRLQLSWITDLGRECIDPSKCKLFFKYMRKIGKYL